jgi:hypothetical protein
VRLGGACSNVGEEESGGSEWFRMLRGGGALLEGPGEGAGRRYWSASEEKRVAE